MLAYASICQHMPTFASACQPLLAGICRRTVAYATYTGHIACSAYTAYAAFVSYRADIDVLHTLYILHVVRVPSLRNQQKRLKNSIQGTCLSNSAP